MLFNRFRAKRRLVERSHRVKDCIALRAAVSEALEARTYFTTFPAPTKLVFISDTPIIVAPGDEITTPTPMTVPGALPNTYYTGVELQLQTNAGVAEPPATTGETTVTLTLSSSTVSNPVFSDGSSTETATVSNPVNDTQPNVPNATGQENYTAYFTSMNGNGLTIDTPGMYVLTATQPGGLSATTSIEVALPTSSTSTVIVPHPTINVGTSEIVELQPADAAGNDFDTYVSSVAFHLTGPGTSSGNFDLPQTYGSSTNFLQDSGVYETEQFTATTAGTPVELGASINGVAVTSTLPTIEVNPGTADPTKSTISVGQFTVTAGLTDTLTFQARDSSGNDLTSGGATVTFSTVVGQGTSNGAIGPTTDNGNGTYTAILTGTTAGTPVKIDATVNGALVTSNLPTITVTPGTVSAAMSTVTVAQTTVAAGSLDVVTFQARDFYGNDLTTGGSTVDFLIVSGSGTSGGALSTAADDGNGTYSGTFTGAAVGTPIQISAIVNGVQITTILPTIQVVPNSASPSKSTISVAQASMTAGGLDTVTLQAVDGSGNNLTTGGLAVTFSVLSANGTSSGFIGPVTDNGDGTYTATFTASTSGTPVRIDATVNGSAVTTQLPTITVFTGTIDPSTSAISVSLNKVVSGQSVTITLQAKDIAGNNLTSGGATVSFALTGSGASAGTISPAVDNNDGTYTATFSASTPGTAIQITATVNGAAVGTVLPSITVIPGSIDPANSVTTTTAIILGQSTRITLQAKDSVGNDLTTGGSTVLFNLSGAVNQVIAAKDNGDGTYTATFTPVGLGTVQITPSIGSASVPSISANVSPVAAAFVLPKGFYYFPGHSLPIKLFNLSPTLPVAGPFTIQLALSASTDGSDPVSVIGGGGTLNGTIRPGQSRPVRVRLGNFPAGFVPYANDEYLVAIVTTPIFLGQGVSASPVLTPPGIFFIRRAKAIHVHQGQLLNIPLSAINKGYTGPAPVEILFSHLKVSGAEQNVNNGIGGGTFSFSVQPLGSGLSLKIASGGFDEKVAHAVGRIRFVIPAVVATNVSVTAYFTDLVGGTTLQSFVICTLDIT